MDTKTFLRKVIKKYQTGKANKTKAIRLLNGKRMVLIKISMKVARDLEMLENVKKTIKQN